MTDKDRITQLESELSRVVQLAKTSTDMADLIDRGHKKEMADLRGQYDRLLESEAYSAHRYSDSFSKWMRLEEFLVEKNATIERLKKWSWLRRPFEEKQDD